MFVGTTGVDRVVAAHRRADARARHRGHRRRTAASRSTSSRSTSTSTTRSRSTCSAARRPPTPRTTSPPASRAAGRRSAARTTTCSPRTPAPSTPSRDGAAHHRRGAGAAGAQPRPAQRVHRRLPRPASSAGTASSRTPGSTPGCRAAARRASTGRSARSPAPHHPGRQADRRRRTWEAPGSEVAADRRGQDARALAHAPRLRARQDRRLDRAAAQRHQRQAASTTSTCHLALVEAHPRRTRHADHHGLAPMSESFNATRLPARPAPGGR